ncbi:hypothetical protein Pmar_PMAR004344, partial [Perkinsus marinus ATCC 50983]
MRPHFLVPLLGAHTPTVPAIFAVAAMARADRKCFACGDKGHLAKACPRVQRSQ